MLTRTKGGGISRKLTLSTPYGVPTLGLGEAPALDSLLFLVGCLLADWNLPLGRGGSARLVCLLELIEMS